MTHTAGEGYPVKETAAAFDVAPETMMRYYAAVEKKKAAAHAALQKTNRDSFGETP